MENLLEKNGNYYLYSRNPQGVLLPISVDAVAGREVIEAVGGIRTTKHFRNLPKEPAVDGLRLVPTNICTRATSS
ncbi:hypothetical protein J6590_080813 [Homalodisca vitripennis]|nr:hypothetical protein J6590_080813 [Homalodisca vitripennis]